jgi:hypothetical protein
MEASCWLPGGFIHRGPICSMNRIGRLARTGVAVALWIGLPALPAVPALAMSRASDHCHEPAQHHPAESGCVIGCCASAPVLNGALAAPLVTGSQSRPQQVPEDRGWHHLGSIRLLPFALAPPLSI